MKTNKTKFSCYFAANIYLLDDHMTTIKLVGSSGNGIVNSINRIIVPRWLRESFKLSNTTNSILGDREIENIDPIRTDRFEPGINRFNQPIIREPSAIDTITSSINTSDGFESSFNTSVNNNTSQGVRDSSTITSIFNGVSAPDGLDIFVKTDNNRSSNIIPITTSNNNNRSSTIRAPSPSPPTTTTTTTTIWNNNSMSRNMRLIEELSSMMSANKFVKLLHKANSEKLLKQGTNYVILVPTDQAIDKLPKQIIQMLERNNQKLEDLVNYHILETTFEYINMIPDGQTLNTINDKDIVFNWYGNNTILTASGSVVVSGVQEDNIALLLVDRVLYPTPGDIMDIISKSPILSNLTRMVRNTGLEQQLSKSGPFTLFAPSDYAFSRLSANDREFLNRDRDAARSKFLRSN